MIHTSVLESSLGDGAVFQFFYTVYIFPPVKHFRKEKRRLIKICGSLVL